MTVIGWQLTRHGTLANEDGQGGSSHGESLGDQVVIGGVWGGDSPLALGCEPLLCERRLVGHRLVLVGPQPGHHVDERQALDLFVERL